MQALPRAAVLLCLLACLSLALSGCGVRIAYNNLDWLLVRWVNQQVSLDAEQERMLRDWLDEELAWHCANQLPAYYSLVEQLRVDLLAGRLNSASMADYGAAIAVFGRSLTERSLPLLIDLAASLDEQQVAEVLAAFDEGTEKVRVRVEEKTLQALVDDRRDSMERSLRRLMGRTNAAQGQRLALWAESVTPTESYHLRQRLYWQGRLAEALAHRDDRATLSEEIAALMRPESAWSEQYQAAMTANRALTLQALEDVIELADPRHINRAAARLTTLRDDFRRLSCEGEAPAALLAEASRPLND